MCVCSCERKQKKEFNESKMWNFSTRAEIGSISGHPVSPVYIDRKSGRTSSSFSTWSKVSSKLLFRFLICLSSKVQKLSLSFVYMPCRRFSDHLSCLPSYLPEALVRFINIHSWTVLLTMSRLFLWDSFFFHSTAVPIQRNFDLQYQH